MNRVGFLVVKWVAIAAVLLLLFWVATQLAAQGLAIGVAIVAFLALAILLIYSTRRAVPLKYLAPGIVALIALQIWPIVFTVAMSFTNYGDGHLGTKDEAAKNIVASSVKEVAGGQRYKMSVAVKEGQDPATAPLTLLLIDKNGKYFSADADGMHDLAESDVTKSTTGEIKSAKGYTILKLGQVNKRKDFAEGKIAYTTGDGKAIKTLGASEAFEGETTRAYDASADTITDKTTGKVFTAKEGRFVADDGEAFSQGWQENVGLANYARIFTDPVIRDGFLSIFVWNIVFAVLTVLGTFLMGMFIALLFNEPRMKGRGLYRSLLILPYAIPTFVTALLWRGMFNEQFGLINHLLHSDVNWLGGPTSAKLAVLITNVWLGFPYMFLVCTGALQSIPGDVKEAALVDGASPFRTLRSIIMPLLLVAVGPLLVASFAFNFNNFSVIWLLTEGGPFTGGNTNIGSTDLLITYAYRMAFAGVAPNYGFAAAVSVVIFVLVAIMTIPTFRGTKQLEEIN